MRPILPHLFGVLSFLLGFTSISFANTVTLCANNNDPIIVDTDAFRETIELSGNVNELQLCNLTVGETYQLNGHKVGGDYCGFNFSLDSEKTLTPGNTSTVTEGENTNFEFVATSSCMNVFTSNTGCALPTNYLYQLSVVCGTCDPEPIPESNTFLPPLAIDQSLSPGELISDIFIGGDCFDVTNVSTIGGAAGNGLFLSGSTSIGLAKGVILSTGNVNNAPGPCTLGNASSPNGGGSDPDLVQLAGTGIGDAAGIEFDFVPTQGMLTFDFVFASEEYCEFVGGFNDVFGFFISGPGITGPFSNGAINIALIPGTTTPVAINNVNQNTNTQFFNSNSTASCGAETNCADIRYDGYTTIFTAFVDDLDPCETYHIKLVVGDAIDNAWDSAVFLGNGSFDAGGDISVQSVVPNSNDNVASEECQDAQFVLTRNALDLDQPLTITFTVGGSATPGLDYTPFPTTITFPANQQVYIIDVEILSDLLVEGTENITFILDMDACSCSGQAGEILIEDYLPIMVPDDDIEVCGPTNSTLAPTVTGGAPTYSYAWSNGQSSATIDVAPSTTTTYTVTVTDQCGNTEDGMITVNVLDAPTATLSGSAAICAGDPSPSATLTVTFTGVGPWDLTYFANGTSQTITGITDNPYDLVITNTGSYSLTTVSNAVCSGTASGTVIVPEVDISLTTIPTNVLCNGDMTGAVDLTVIGGDPTYTYVWDNGAGSEDLLNIGTGSYNVVVTDANGCTEETGVNITEPPVLSSFITMVSPINCNGEASGVLDLTVGGGSPGYSFMWSNGSQSEDISSLTAGPYTVTITDSNNCTTESSIILTEPDPMLTSTLVLQNVTCAGGNNGTVDLTVSGGNFPYFFNWSNGSIEEDPNNFEEGSYTVVITDVNGCTAIEGVFITEPTPILAQALEVQGVNCNNPNGGWADLTVGGGSPGYSYLWDNGSILEDPQDLSEGPHTVVITDANGCTQSADVTITSDTSTPNVEIDVIGLISCTNTNVTLDGTGSTGSGTLTYEWQDANGTIISNDPTTDVLTSGNYTLIVTNGDNGCTSSTSAMVDENSEVPVADAQVSGLIDCNNMTATLDGSGSTGNGTLEYEWQNSNGDVIDTEVSTDIGDTGMYTLIVTADNGCTSSISINVEDDIVAPTPDAQVSGLITCQDGMATLNGTGSTGGGTISYEWFDTSNASIGTNGTVDVSETGLYTLIITDSSNGCTSETTIEVDEDIEEPVPDAQVSGVINCTTTMVTLDGSNSTSNGTLEYEWFNTAGNSVGINDQVDVSLSGEYTLIVTNTENGCTAEIMIDVMENTEDPTALATVDDALDCQTTDVTLDGSTSTTNGTPQYEWQDPTGASVGASANLDVSVPGIYTLIITDSENGCTSETTIEVEEDIAVPTPDAVADGTLTCANLDVTIDGSGSTSNGTLTYEWFNSAGNSIGVEDNIDVTAPDTYTLIITDSQSGCTSETSLLIEQDIEEPTANAGPGTSLTCADTEVSLNGDGSSTGGGFSYEWLNNGGVTVGNDISVDVSETGIYTLIVTDDTNGCTASATVEVTPDADLPVADAGLGSDITCIVEEVTLDGSNSTSVGNISYEWTDPNGVSIGGDLIIDVTLIGTYTLVVTNDDNGCSASSSVEVSEDITPPNADAGTIQFITCTETEATLDGSNSSGNDLSYEWLDAGGMQVGTTASITVNVAEEYTLIVTDGINGCTASSTVEVETDSNVPTSDAGQDGLLNCLITDYTLDGSNSTGGTLEYEWQDPNGVIVGDEAMLDVSVSGIYTLIVTDTDNGCTSTSTAFVDQDTTDPIPEAGDNSLINCMTSDTELDAGASTGGTLSYEWQDPNGVTIGNTQIVTATEVGIYNLIITNDDNGCTASDQVEVTGDFVAPIPDAGQDGLLTCTTTAFELDGSASTGTGALNYEWFDPNNVSLATTETYEVSQTGTYTLLITNTENGCTASTTVFVDENIATPTANAGLNATLTCDDTEVTLTGSGMSQSGTVSFEWFNDGGMMLGTEANVMVDQIGTYTLVVTDTDNGCTMSSTVEVQADANLPTSNAGQDGMLNCLITDYTLDGSNSTGGTLEYEWQDPNGVIVGDEAMLNVSVSGIYTLIVTDTDNGCTSTSTAFVDQDTTDPIPEAGDNSLLNCLISDTELDAGASTGGTLSYEWQDPNGVIIGNTQVVTATEAGIYNLIITNDDNGCTASDQVEVLGDFVAPNANAGQDGLLTCTTTSFELDASASTGTGTLSYEWFDEADVSLATTELFEVSQTGTYTLLITNTENGCTASTTVFVDENIATPTANAGLNATLTCDDTEVTLTGGGTSQSGNVAFEWFNEGGVMVGTEANVTVDQTGTYTLIVTDTDNGCTMSSTVDVTPDSNLPDANAGSSSTLTCTTIMTTLDGSASSSGMNISYQWLDENGVNVGGDASIEVTTPGVYTLVVTDSNNGCSSSSSVEVFEDIDIPTAFAGENPTLTCDDTEATLDGSGSSANTGILTFEWSNPNGDIIGNSETVIVDVSGIYTLTITAENGCTNTDEVEVLVDSNVPIADVGLGGMLDCITSVITLGGNNTSTGLSISHVWENEDGDEIANTPTTDISMPGTYTLIVSNSDNNCETSTSITIPQDIEAPSVDAGSIAMLTCNLTVYQIGGVGSSVGPEFEYQWTNLNGDVISNEMTTEVSTPDTYTLLITDTENGCTSSESVIITQDIATPVSVAGTGGILTCDVSEITLDGSNSTGLNLSYEWLNAAGVVVSTEASFPASETGTYTLVVTNTANGCSSESTTSITPDANLPTATASPIGILTCVNNNVILDGSASSSISGNIAYVWLNDTGTAVSTEDTYNTSIPGIYTLIVTDTENGCTSTTTLEALQDIASPSANAGINQTLTCGQTDVTLTGVGGNGTNLSFEWQDDQGTVIGTSESVTVSIAGTYTFIVTNEDNGCTSTSTTQVVPDTNLPNADAGTAATLTCNVSMVTLDASGSSTGTNISYEWQDASGAILGTDLTLDVTEPGTYILFVTNNDNNCQSQDQIVVIEDETPPVAFADYGSAQSLDCDNASLTLDATASEPAGQLTFAWTTIDGNIQSGANTLNPEIDQAGTYTLTVTNIVNGCTDSYDIMVDQNVDPPVALIENPDILNCIDTEVSLDASGSSNNGNFSYSWSGAGITSGGNTLNPTVNQAGTFILTVVNEDNGCETTASITVDEDVTTPVALASTDESFDCITESVSISGNGSSTGPTFSYLWSGNGTIQDETSLNTTVFSSGVYTLLVTDSDNGCTSSTTLNVAEDTNVPNAIDAIIQNPECFGDQGFISIVEIMGGTAPYVVSIDGGETFFDQTFYSNLDPGNYDIVIQDATGCEYEESLFIESVIEVDVIVEPVVELQFGDSYEIVAIPNIPLQDIDTIIWTPATGLSCTDCLNPTVDTILNSASYTVTIINLNGCSDTDEIVLRVRKDKDVFIPNAFSPGNGDGINDLLTVYGNSNRIAKIKSFQVFDRWGELVFENFDFLPNNPAEGWNGMFRGESLNPAVYVYWAEVEFIDGSSEIFKGDVTILD